LRPLNLWNLAASIARQRRVIGFVAAWERVGLDPFNPITVEVNRDPTGDRFPSPALKAKDVVPPIGMEWIKQQRTTQHKPNVLASHAGADPLDGIPGQIISLGNIEPERLEYVAVGQARQARNRREGWQDGRTGARTQCDAERQRQATTIPDFLRDQFAQEHGSHQSEAMTAYHTVSEWNVKSDQNPIPGV